jgi:hypothetical protein
MGQDGDMRILWLFALLGAGIAGQAQECGACHAEQAATKKEGKHTKLECATCHGPQEKHISSGGKEKPAKFDALPLCLQCHETGKSKREDTLKVNPNEHYAGSKCVDCHLPHKPQT